MYAGRGGRAGMQPGSLRLLGQIPLVSVNQGRISEAWVIAGFSIS